MFADIRTPVRLYPSCGSNSSSKPGPFEKKKLLQYLYFKSVREPLVHEDSNIDHGGALFEAKKQKITFILIEKKRCASSKIF